MAVDGQLVFAANPGSR